MAANRESEQPNGSTIVQTKATIKSKSGEGRFYLPPESLRQDKRAGTRSAARACLHMGCDGTQDRAQRATAVHALPQKLALARAVFAHLR